MKFQVINSATGRATRKLTEKRVSDGLSLAIESLKHINDFGPSLPYHLIA